MGTKKDPGKYDCYGKLKEDEPYFVLRAQDESAPVLVDMWADNAESYGVNRDKIEEARKVADEMRNYRTRKTPD